MERWEPVLLASLATAGLATALFHAGIAERRAGLLIFAASAGFLLGAASLCRMENAVRGSFLPVPAGGVSRFSGSMIQDSGLSQTGDTVLRVALREVWSEGRGLRGEARGGVLVLLKGDYRFALGERLSFRAQIAELDSPGPERYFARVDMRDVRTEGFNAGAWAFRARARDWLHRAVARTGYPASALLEALLIGSREDVPEQLYDDFRRTGSLHILALSGLHVTVIYGMVAGLLGFVRKRAARFLLATALLLFYQFLAGFMPSLLRATVMIVIGGTAMLLDRDSEPLNLLALSGIVVLLMDPFQAFSLSFQLSFLAMGGILAIGPLVQRPLEGWVPRVLLIPLAMSVGAQVATFPLVVARFGIYYPSGLAAGLLLVPLTTALLWAGLAWLPLFLIPWPLLHDLCATGFSALYTAIDWCARVFAQLPGIPVPPARVPWVAGLAVTALLCLATLLPARPRAPLRQAA
jgi:competence protein ComEC